MSNQLSTELLNLPIDDDNIDDSFSSSDSSDSCDGSEENDDETGYEEHEVDEDNNENSNNNRTRSWVWNHYTRDKNTKKARCNHCKELIAVNKGSTSGMIKHAKSKHKITNNQHQKNQNRQLTLQESMNNSSEIIVSLLIIILFDFLIL